MPVYLGRVFVIRIVSQQAARLKVFSLSQFRKIPRWRMGKILAVRRPLRRGSYSSRPHHMVWVMAQHA